MNVSLDFLCKNMKGVERSTSDSVLIIFTGALLHLINIYQINDTKEDLSGHYPRLHRQPSQGTAMLGLNS